MLTRYGVVVAPVGPWREQEAAYRWAEDVGYDVAYTFDHLTHPTLPGQWLSEGFTGLAAAAGVTTRLELGVLVASATLRSAVALARIALSVQDISGGRLVLGVGAGAPFCAAADRGEEPTPAQMSATYADVVTGYRAVLAGETEWRGATTSFTGLQTLPRPEGVADPFLLLAAHGPRACRLTAEQGDGWSTYGGPGSAAMPAEEYWRVVAEQVARMDDACAAAGRDPGSLRRSLLLGFGQVQPSASVAAYVEGAERAAALGFDELVVYAPGAGADPAVHEDALARLRA